MKSNIRWFLEAKGNAIGCLLDAGLLTREPSRRHSDGERYSAVRLFSHLGFGELDVAPSSHRIFLTKLQCGITMIDTTIPAEHAFRPDEGEDTTLYDVVIALHIFFSENSKRLVMLTSTSPQDLKDPFSQDTLNHGLRIWTFT